MKRYFYFRDVADEINDDDNSSSLMLPVENITAIAPSSSITTLDIWYKNIKNESVNDYVTLTVTRGRLKQVTAELVAAMNAGPHTTIVDVLDVDNTIYYDGFKSLIADSGFDMVVTLDVSSS